MIDIGFVPDAADSDDPEGRESVEELVEELVEEVLVEFDVELDVELDEESLWVVE